MTIASAIFKQVVAKKQTALGSKASASGAQVFRRTTSTIDLTKDSYQSQEKRTSQQKSDFRHGLRSVSGTISGELSVGTYQSFFESVLRAAAVSTGAYSAGTDVTSSATAPQFVDASAGFLTAGLKAGMVGRWSGFAGGSATDNNGREFLITDLTAGNMTGAFLDGTAVVADAAGDSVTFTPTGKSISIPSSSHTRDYWTIEHVFADITQSEQFTDCMLAQANLKFPETGIATVDFPVVGLNVDTSTAAYFTTPTAVSSGDQLTSVSGAIYAQGAAIALIKSLDVNINGNAVSVGAVQGSNVSPDIVPGSIDVTGNMTVLFANATVRDYFLDETEVSLVAVYTTNGTATPGFMSIAMPVVKLGSATKDDGDRGISMTCSFTAVENTAGGTGTATNATTITIYDSAYA